MDKLHTDARADIGILGGSGFYSFLKDITEADIDTPYGKPSDKISIAAYDNKKVAFLPRHDRNHSIPPHLINYRANIYAMHMLGVKYIIGPTASGSLQASIKPGDFVICDQFIDRTTNRKDTFFEGPKVEHISAAYPYCAELRKIAYEAALRNGVTVHKKGTVVIIQGPRFSTVAESRWYSKMGWEVINMTNYPECILAKEMGICYANISLITDYDAGLEGRDDIKPVTNAEVLRVFEKNNDVLKNVLFDMIKHIDLNAECSCSDINC